MSSLKALVYDIMHSRDFGVVERDGLIHCKKGDVEVVFFIMEMPDERKLDEFVSRTKGLAGRKVIATLSRLPEGFMNKVPSGIIVWDREAIEHEIGRVHIERIVGNREAGLVDEFVADDYPRTVSAEDLDKFDVLEVGERIVKPIVNVDAAKEIGARTVEGFRFRLELVPHYLFRYACALYIDHHRLGMQEGTLAINALTNETVEWPENMELVLTIDQSHQRLEPRIDIDESKAFALDEIMARHTAERDVVRESGNVTVTERKKVSPKRDEIVLESLGIHYLPVWCVEGVKGVMVLNAGTGKIISEDYYSKDLS
ncbi:MAG: hypothetical protein HPY73_04930 [Methanomassiliicoccales archaeon]|nr:MAG: hypothetical protein HPY73_04930 [Methanomassiliicoccales archaeon]